MVQVDLITGFLGAGKTTFLRRYVRYLVQQGHKVCILENDFGAVNVDAMLVQELLERRDILDQEPRFREEGLSALATAVYHLTNGHL